MSSSFSLPVLSYLVTPSSVHFLFPLPSPPPLTSLLLHPFLIRPSTRFKWCWTWAPVGASHWASQSWWHFESFFLCIISFSSAQRRHLQILLDGPGTLWTERYLSCHLRKANGSLGKAISWLACLKPKDWLTHLENHTLFRMTDSKGVFWRPARDGNTEGGKQFALGPGWQDEELHWKPGGALKERSEKARLLRDNPLTEVGWID